MSQSECRMTKYWISESTVLIYSQCFTKYNNNKACLQLSNWGGLLWKKVQQKINHKCDIKNKHTHKYINTLGLKAMYKTQFQSIYTIDLLNILKNYTTLKWKSE